MKKILFFLILHLSYHMFSQVGLGTPTPRGDLDMNTPLTNIYGLVLPTNASPTNMQNPQGGNVPFGTMMFHSTANCIKYYQQNMQNDVAQEKWSNCLLSDGQNLPSVDYIPVDNAFSGNYTQNVAFTTANTYRIAITNNSFFTPITINFSRTDLILSGLEEVSVSAVSPASVTLAPGQVQILTYTLTGTPTNCGPLTATWRKMDLQYAESTNVKPNVTYDCAAGAWDTPVSPEYRLNGLVDGESYTGTYTVPYLNGGTCDLPPETITVNGLTLTYAGGPISAAGTITYVLSGTFIDNPLDSGVALFTTAGGCTIYLGPCSTCKEILEIFPGTPDGVYKINVDKQARTFATSNAQCDMTTDGGGWTLMANYVVPYAVQPLPVSAGSLPTNSFKTKLPLINSETLGDNEVGNPTSFGSGGNYLGGFILAPTEWRVWGVRSNNNTTDIAETAHWKAPMTTTILNNMRNNAGFANSTLPTPLPGNTVTLTLWGDPCCSAWGGRRTNNGYTGFDNYGFWHGYLQINRTNNSGIRNSIKDNAMYRVWVR